MYVRGSKVVLDDDGSRYSKSSKNEGGERAFVVQWHIGMTVEVKFVVDPRTRARGTVSNMPTYGKK